MQDAQARIIRSSIWVDETSLEKIRQHVIEFALFMFHEVVGNPASGISSQCISVTDPTCTRSNVPVLRPTTGTDVVKG